MSQERDGRSARGPLATRIVVEYDDGTVKEASGPDAAKIMEWWQSTESLAFVHGMRYEGPCLRERTKPRLGKDKD